MERNAYAFAAGLFVLALGLGALAAARWLEGPEAMSQPYVVVSESSVAGLSPFSKVYYRGVEVGQVTDIRFAQDGSREILISIELERRVPVTVNTYATLKAQGLTGLAFIELLDDGPVDAATLKTGQDAPARIAMRPSLLESFQAVGQGIAEQIQQLAGNINQLFTPENTEQLGRIIANIENASARLDAVLAGSHSVVEQLEPLVQQGEQTFAQAENTLRTFDETLEALRTPLEEAERLLATTSDTVTQVGGRVGSDILPQLESALGTIADAADRIDRLTENLERDPPALLWGTAVPRPGPGETGYSGD